MPFFHGRGLAELRAITDTDRPHRADLLVATSVSTGGGGWRETFAVLRSAVPCRLSSISPTTVGQVTRDQAAPPGATWRVVFGVGDDLSGADRLTVTGTEDTGDAFLRSLDVLRGPLPQTDSMLRVLYCVDVVDEEAA